MNSCYQFSPDIFKIHTEVTLKALASSRTGLGPQSCPSALWTWLLSRLPLPIQAPPVTLPHFSFLPQPRLEEIIHCTPFSWPLLRVWGNKGRRDVSVVRARARQDTRGTERWRGVLGRTGTEDRGERRVKVLVPTLSHGQSTGLCWHQHPLFPLVFPGKGAQRGLVGALVGCRCASSPPGPRVQLGREDPQQETSREPGPTKLMLK